MKKHLLLAACWITMLTAAVAQLNTTLVGRLTYSTDLADVWGYVDQSGNEYAIVGRNDGISIVSLQDPANPTEIFFVPGPNSIWRDMYIYNDVLYTTNETGGGLSIIDLSGLPNSIGNESLYTGNNYPFETAHNLIGDENGYLYIFGADYGNGGAIILDLNQDPLNPVEVGLFDTYYIHDGNVKGDTLWASCINDGIHAMIDVSDKANPVVMATFSTPHNFTHNSWYSDNSKYVFTTDEVSGAYITSYDVSDFSNITELDRFQSNPGSGVIPHNAHYINGYLVISYYRDGLVVVDAARPHNLIEVANYDTSPNYSGDGFNGAWGAYPWLPSGLVLVSDIEEGLYVFSVNYQRACYLEGTVTDANCGAPITNATVEIIGETQENVKSDGSFATGTANAGTYTVVVSAPGYNSYNTTVTLSNGTVTNLDVQLSSSLTVNVTGNVKSTSNQSPLANAVIEMYNSTNFYSFTTDNNGQFNSCNFVSGNYNVYVSKWGYQTLCLLSYDINSGNTTLNFELEEGYYDDFTTDLGWTIVSTASTGKWERGIPNATFYNGVASNPATDYVNDCGEKAYVTGNMASPNYWDDDIDNGYTMLISPPIDLAGYTDAYLNFVSWFFNDGGNGTPNDYVRYQITNGTDTVTLLEVTAADNMSTWEYHSFYLPDYITLTSNMKFIALAEDADPGNITEAGLDYFYITASGVSATSNNLHNNITVFPNPASETLRFSEQVAKVILQDLSGKTILSARNTNHLDISNLSPGTYLAFIITKEQKTIQKIVIQ
ncbi:MAG: choice-of-anchor B family protein [Bacteroidetes bacterium]|nr:MAG: choice-of-anchor B family protein [Bacteroidota bacterium]